MDFDFIMDRRYTGQFLSGGVDSILQTISDHKLEYQYMDWLNTPKWFMIYHCRRLILHRVKERFYD